jgi:hypothetical protein
LLGLAWGINFYLYNYLWLARCFALSFLLHLNRVSHRLNNRTLISQVFEFHVNLGNEQLAVHWSQKLKDGMSQQVSYKRNVPFLGAFSVQVYLYTLDIRVNWYSFNLIAEHAFSLAFCRPHNNDAPLNSAC